MRTDLFDYDLPEELVARHPPAERDGARMLCLEPAGVRHGEVKNFPNELQRGDLVVLNETRVRRARLFVQRLAPDESVGGRGELLFLERISPSKRAADGAADSLPLGSYRAPAAESESDVEHWLALGRANRPLRVGDRLVRDGVVFVVDAKSEDGVLEVRAKGDVESLLLAVGEMPIPPYMQRPGQEEDLLRYQTVFAKKLGSAAAPTAGLHVTEAMLAAFEARGVEVARLVLHVGIGTFRPVEVDDLDAHAMHAEWIEVGEDVAHAIRATRRRGGRVVAVGTTVVRALESSADPGEAGCVLPQSGQTRLLIQPGYRFRIVDALLTNFHMPRSTLLALVSAFAGRERILSAYREAVLERYRFFSYGDAMWLPRRAEDFGPAGGAARGES